MKAQSIYEASSFNFRMVSLKDWTFIFYYGIVVTIIAFILWFRGITKVAHHHHPTYKE